MTDEAIITKLDILIQHAQILSEGMSSLLSERTQTVEKAMKPKKKNGSTEVEMFVKEKCELRSNATIPKGELFRAYCEWSQERGGQCTEWPAVFGRRLLAEVDTVTTYVPRAARGKRVQSYQGIKLASDKNSLAITPPISDQIERDSLNGVSS